MAATSAVAAELADDVVLVDVVLVGEGADCVTAVVDVDVAVRRTYEPESVFAALLAETAAEGCNCCA